jgi:hypothetical protein
MELQSHSKPKIDSVQVILAYFLSPDTTAAAKAGVSRILAKPVDFSILIPLVREILGKSKDLASLDHN